MNDPLVEPLPSEKRCKREILNIVGIVNNSQVKQAHTKTRPLNQSTIHLHVLGHIAACKGIGTLAYRMTTAKLLANY